MHKTRVPTVLQFIDAQKGFDCVEWDFIKIFMERCWGKIIYVKVDEFDL